MDQHTETEEITQQTEQEEKETGFAQQLVAMPKVMQTRFFQQIGAGIVSTILTLAAMICFKTWSYSIGLLIALYFAYTGMDLVWGYHSGKIVRKRVIVLKNAYRAKSDFATVSLREIDSDGYKLDELYQVRLYGKKEKLNMLESNLILEIFFRPSYTADVLAWEITDYVG